MKTLLTLFNKGRSEVQTEIDKATSSEQVVKLVQNQLDDLERNYVGELSVAQVRLASFFLETLRQSLGTIAATNEKKVENLEVGQNINQATRSPKSLILKLLEGLICVGVLGTSLSLTQTAPEAWMVILLMSLLVGLEVTLQLDKENQENSTYSSVQRETPQISAGIDSKVLLDNLADALNTIDRAIAQAEESKKPLDSSGIEALPELLNFLQRLMGASFLEKPQMALAVSKLLPQILMEQGIQAKIYQPNDERSNHEYFDFEPNIDRSAKDYVTITPALLKGDRLLRRGRVIEPAYSEAKE